MRNSLELDISPARLRHIRWIGGGSGAGKSTIARQLAEKYGLCLYQCDEMQHSHTARSSPTDHLLLHAFIAMTMDERWVQRTPEEMFRTFHGYQGEGFELLLEDLLAMPTDQLVLVEGFRLLPRLVAPLLNQLNQAVWLLPTPQFRRAALENRESLWSIAGRTSDPERALSNLLARDAIFTEEIFKEAVGLHFNSIEIDGSCGIEEVVERVEECLGLTPGYEPLSRTLFGKREKGGVIAESGQVSAPREMRQCAFDRRYKLPLHGFCPTGTPPLCTVLCVVHGF